MTIDVTEIPTTDDIEGDGLLFASGTLGDDGLLYFPTIFTDGDARWLVVNPADGSSSLELGTTGVGDWVIGEGYNLPGTDVIAYVLTSTYNAAAKNLWLLDPSSGTVSAPTVSGTNVSTGCVSSCMHSNGLLYCFRGISGGSRISKINVGAMTGSAVSAAPISATVWYPSGATEGSDGLIYCATGYWRFSPTPGDGPILIYDPGTDSATFSHMGLPSLGQKQFYAEGVAMPDGTIVFIPGIYFDGDPNYPAMIVDPGSGTAWLQSTTLPPIGFKFGNDPRMQAFQSGGIIYYSAQSLTDDTESVLVGYDPVADTFDTWVTSYIGVFGDPPMFQLGNAGGVLFGAPGTTTGAGYYSPANLIIRIGASGFSWYVGDIPVELYIGDIPVEGLYWTG